MPAAAIRPIDVLGPGSPLSRRMEGYEHRDGQLAMADAVARALEDERHLFVEAGTGTGKTLAYLVPAILSGKKVVVSTATHALQDQIYEKDLPLVRGILEEHGVVFQAALMKGLSNYLCKRRAAERMRSGEPVGVELARIQAWAEETRTGDRAELTMLEEGAPAWRDVASGADTRIGAGCTYFDECFVTTMKRLADDATLLVVNHHLFFADLALKSANDGYGGALPAYDAVIFDEAHQIESIATDFFGVRISSGRVEALVRDGRRGLAKRRDGGDDVVPRLLDDLDASARTFFRAWGDVATAPPSSRAGRGGEGRKRIESADWTPRRRDALARLDASLDALARAADAEASDPMIVVARRASSLALDLARIGRAIGEERHWEPDDPLEEAARAATRGFDGGVTWIDARERNGSLGASPVDVAPLLEKHLFDRVRTVICTSATLATGRGSGGDFAFAKQRLGASDVGEELIVPSPFDFAARAVLYVAEDMPEPTELGFDLACADRVAELVAITGGGAFVLCTSTQAMRSIALALDGRVPGDLLVQGDAPKHVLLDAFRRSTDATLVATMSFWEGVDVPGNALRLVVLDKIPFAVPTDPVVAARCAAIEANGGNPFTEYSVPSAAITLKQGFGRLIRTREDAGVVALLDRRAVRRGYGKRLLATLPPARRLTHIEEVREFWWNLA